MTNLEYKEEKNKVEKLNNITNSFSDLQNNYSEIKAEQIALELSEMYENENINNLNDFKNKNIAVATKLDKMIEDEEFVGNVDKLDTRTRSLKHYQKEKEITLFDKIKGLVRNVALGTLPILSYFYKAFSYVLSKVNFLIKGLIGFLSKSLSNPIPLLKYIGIAVVAWYLFKLMKKPMLYILEKIKTERQLTNEQINEAFSSDNLKIIIREEENTFEEKTVKKVEEIKENVGILNDMLTQLNVLRLTSMLSIFAFLFGLYKMVFWMLIGSGIFVCVGVIKDYYNHVKNQKTGEQPT